VPRLLAALVLIAGITPAALAQSALRLYVFDCGELAFDDVSAFGLSNEETRVREMFVPCYLIEHPNGRLLWDAGLPIGIAGKGDRELEPGVTMRYAVSLPVQLAKIGIMPADVDRIAFSHMHFDHVGAANLFTESELLIQQAEYQAAFVARIEQFQPELYLGLVHNERRILNGDYDVFGDGKVTIVAAPGHTPGHQVLLLRLDNTGPLVLSGDLYHFRESRVLRRAPTFNTDAEATFRSMDEVEALIAREGATLWIEHDKALAETLRKAPEYYD